MRQSDWNGQVGTPRVNGFAMPLTRLLTAALTMTQRDMHLSPAALDAIHLLDRPGF